MASIDFSWSDSLQAAFSSCLPCLKSPPEPDSFSDAEDQQRHRHSTFAHAIPPPRARPDELEGLLADASDDVDALSLHTNPGDRTRRKKKKRRGAPKHIRVFGYDLFGRAPAIQLPESEDEGLIPGARRRPGRTGAGHEAAEGRSRTISSSSMDSDAAPLDAAAIEEMSAARAAEARVREEEERRAKEERRRRRRERKEMKRAAMARALDMHANGPDGDFEGFQGSGPAFDPALTSPFAPSLTSGTGSGTLSHSSQEFGPFAHGQPVQPFDPEAAESADAEAADGADFGGESYTSRPRSKSKSTSGGRAMSGTTSDTRSSSSRGTGSAGYTFVHPGAGAAPYNHQYLAQQVPSQIQAMPRSPLSPTSGGSDSVPPSPMSPSRNVVEKKKKRRKSKSTAASLSISNSNSSHSATTGTVASSLAPLSPPPAAHEAMPTIVIPPEAGTGGFGRLGGDFEGFPGDFGSTDFRAAAVAAAGAGSEARMVDFNPVDADGVDDDEERDRAREQRKTEYLPVAGFPSAGLRGTERRNSDMGVFLARRGDE